MGHSFGGTFATYSLLTKPDLFDAYIAISPYLHYDDNYLVKMAEHELKSKYHSRKYFYMSVGNEPNYFLPLGEFSSLIKEKSAKSIEFEYVKMEKENHGTIPYISLFNGLRFIFSDWQLPREILEKDLTSIDEYYKISSIKYGIDIQTPENVINFLGYAKMQSNDFESAIVVLKENVKRYPNSANVYDSLGEAFENNNELNLAKENYQKACRLGKKFADANLPVYEKNLARIKSF